MYIKQIIQNASHITEKLTRIDRNWTNTFQLSTEIDLGVMKTRAEGNGKLDVIR